jgi:hypothetical protein
MRDRAFEQAKQEGHKMNFAICYTAAAVFAFAVAVFVACIRGTL